MADCGAAGTTIDRLLAHTDAGKHVAALAGHATLAGGAQALSGPLDRVSLPSLPVLRAPEMQGSVVQAPRQHVETLLPQAQLQHQSHPLHHHNHVIHQPPMHQEPTFHPMAMMQQQQHMMAMMQQQQQYMLQHQQKKQADYANDWHEGLDEGHEGLARGATMEELAAAWKEAEVALEDAVDDDVANLWSGEVEDEVYQFQHPVSSETPDADWMGQGMEHFAKGDLKPAIHAFEMEVQARDSSAAWRMLGRCHAENDQDQQAILCLQQAVERDPYSSEALLALGVSYVNELNHEKALESLKGWITNNPKFAGMSVTDDLYGPSESASEFEEAQRLLLHALEFNPSDANVLEALGVVYNVSRDYDAAVDSFRKALIVRPDDYQLWNKLGATLANAGQSQEALPAYDRALAIKPKYARAWLNMAISYSNLHNYDEAARCYLQTLSLNPSAVHCWSYLRIALSCSERWDLIPLAASQDLMAFREHFDFTLPEQGAAS